MDDGWVQVIADGPSLETRRPKQAVKNENQTSDAFISVTEVTLRNHVKWRSVMNFSSCKEVFAPECQLFKNSDAVMRDADGGKQNFVANNSEVFDQYARTVLIIATRL